MRLRLPSEVRAQPAGRSALLKLYLPIKRSRPGGYQVVTRLRFPTLLIPVLLLTAVMTSCASPRERAFQDLLPAERAQVDLKMSLMTPGDTVHWGEYLHVLVENTSGRPISFPGDLGARIFAYEERGGHWIEVENRVSNIEPAEPLILAPEGEVPINQHVLWLWPYSRFDLDAKYLRIMVVGRQLEGEEPAGPPVVEFLEVRLNR